MSATPTFAKTLADAIETRLTGLHTMLPGKVVKVDLAAGKCDVKPSIKRINSDGDSVELPVITNCPIGFYRAGKAAIYLPLAIGHSVEIRFCERSLDIWLSKGGTVDPDDARKHHLSDATVYPGLYDFKNPPMDADSEKVVVVNDKSKITLDPAGEIKVSNDTGFILVSTDGKFNFQSSSDELLALLVEFMEDLIEATTLDPVTGPQEFTPDTVTVFQDIKTRLEGMIA